MRRHLLLGFLGLAAIGNLSCGGEEPEGPQSHIAFQQHALMCDIPGCDMLPQGITCIQAKLEATGVPGVCPLTVGADRTVSGVCRTPAKEIRDFRLVYYTFLGVEEIQLAVVLARLDLREQTEAEITLEFPQSRLMASFDDDNDGRSNIQEICEGTNPRMQD